MENEFTANRARDLLDYNPITGDFTWKINRRGRRQKGTSAGCIHPNGYVRISIDYRLYNAQRLAWLFISGNWPEKFIDHIDGNPSNNQASNLRQADSIQNGANRKISASNKSGYKGVSFVKSTQKWGAWIKVAGRSKNLGSNFPTPEEAHEAYKKASNQLHGLFANHG
jgi:hypothetical protein